MPRTLIAALAACSLGSPAQAAEWTERYFGIGSAGDRTAACGEARDHAQGNSFNACMERRGKRGGTEYTDCICAAAGERMHVCNVNLKVRCDGADQSAGAPSLLQRRGEPRGQAGRGLRTIARKHRPAPEARSPAEGQR